MKEQLKIYNTLTKTKDIFNPIDKNCVGMYVCGPTVYGEPHLGHASPAIVFDVIFRYFTHLGYKTRYVRNITDVGHLENDSDDGIDKIEKKAKSEMLEPMEVAQYYTEKYHECLKKLNCLSPSIEPRATGHIIEQIEMIEKIIKNGFAYVKNGSVYMDVKKYSETYNYGVLSGRKIEDNIDGTRELESQSEKKHAADFALWKKASNRHIMKWNSPWGVGFPGWHIECSAMSKKYLGENFDIHGGGLDLIFPHHEAEICQSYAADLCPPANYWIHNNMITIDGQKMGKSLGNFINLNEFFNGSHTKLDKSYHPMVIRFLILQAHYRGTIDFSNDALVSCEKGLNKLLKSYENIENINCEKKGGDNDDLEKIKTNCYSALNDDFNTPIVIANLFELSKIINTSIKEKITLTFSQKEVIKKIFDIFLFELLGIKKIVENINNDLSKELMKLIIDLRDNSKKNKDWETADIIRDKLSEINIQIKDTRDGTNWELNE